MHESSAAKKAAAAAAASKGSRRRQESLNTTGLPPATAAPATARPPSSAAVRTRLPAGTGFRALSVSGPVRLGWTPSPGCPMAPPPCVQNRDNTHPCNPETCVPQHFKRISAAEFKTNVICLRLTVVLVVNSSCLSCHSPSMSGVCSAVIIAVICLVS
jgi:hypothetical protein